MKLKNKIILILLSIILFILILTFNEVQAVEYDEAFPNFSHLVEQTGYSSYIIYKYNNIPHLVLIDDVNTYFNCTGTFDYWAGKGNINNLSKEYILDNNSWVECEFDMVNSYGNFCLIFSRNDTNYSNYIYFNNIKISIDDSEVYSIHSIPDDYVFFQVPVQGVVVPALEKVEELPKAITETLKVIIPVGLVLLGIILIIYLIKRVIYLSQ